MKIWTLDVLVVVVVGFLYKDFTMMHDNVYLEQVTVQSKNILERQQFFVQPPDTNYDTQYEAKL